MAKKVYKVGKHNKPVRKRTRRVIDIDGDKKPDIVVTTYTQPSTADKAPVTVSISPVTKTVVAPVGNKCKTKNCKQKEGPANYQGYCGDCARCFKIVG